MNLVGNHSLGNPCVKPNQFLISVLWIIIIVKLIFSCKSDSRIANVRLSVRQSVSHQNPSASQNWSYQPLSPLTMEPINHQAHWQSSLSTIKPIDHQAYWPSSLLTIKPIDHWVYRTSSLSTIKPIEPIDHQAYRPSSLLTSGLLSRLLSLYVVWKTASESGPTGSIEIFVVNANLNIQYFYEWTFCAQILSLTLNLPLHENKLKTLKVAKSKDENLDGGIGCPNKHDL